MTTGVSLDRARAAKSEAMRLFAEIAGDAAVGVTALEEGTYGLKVNLKTSPRDEVVLPSEVEGVPVQVEIVGTIRKR